MIKLRTAVVFMLLSIGVASSALAESHEKIHSTVSTTTETFIYDFATNVSTNAKNLDFASLTVTDIATDTIYYNLRGKVISNSVTNQDSFIVSVNPDFNAIFGKKATITGLFLDAGSNTTLVGKANLKSGQSITFESLSKKQSNSIFNTAITSDSKFLLDVKLRGLTTPYSSTASVITPVPEP